MNIQPATTGHRSPGSLAALAALVIVFVFHALLAFDAQGQTPPDSTGSSLTVKEARDVVDYHNKLRKDVGSGELKWSADLAAVSQAWADKLAASGEISHSGGKYGENVAFDVSAQKGAEAWAAEIKLYTPGTKLDGENYKSFGHYTQMVWKKSTEIGVGAALITQGPFKGQFAIVASYNPPGNVTGQLPY